MKLEPGDPANWALLMKVRRKLRTTVASGSGLSTGSGLGGGLGSGLVKAPSATKNEEVFAKLQQFLDCKQAIEQTWAGISSGQLERVPGVDTVQLPDMSWNYALR